MSGLEVNPRDGILWDRNSIATGRARRHRVDPLKGTLSIKTILEGQASWKTPDGRYEVTPDTCLILNEGQTYELDIDSPSPVHTFCVFFRSGLVEEVAADRGLRGEIGFYERLNLVPEELKAPMAKLRVLAAESLREPSPQLRRPSPYRHDPSDRERERGDSHDPSDREREKNDSLETDEAMIDLALALMGTETAPREESRLEMAKPSSRHEVFRMLNRSRDYALACLDSRLSLDDLAEVACMSPFHFHRLHRQAFGETPHEFVTRARIARAARLLRAGRDIGDVSLALGFESVPTFCRLFKSRTGQTPGAFRKIG